MRYRREMTINHLFRKLKHWFAILSRLKGSFSSQMHKLLAAILGVGIGVAGLYVSLWDGKIISVPFIFEQYNALETVYTVAGLQNLGNNCFLNVILQALASSSYFLSFLHNILLSDDLENEETDEKMPLTVALSSLLEDLSIVRDEKSVLNPRRVMLAMSSYTSGFNLTRQQDAAEAFFHLLSALEEEISECYMKHNISVADITNSPSKIYNRKKEGHNECERWKEQFLGPFDGTIGSSLTCKSCSSMLSTDFEFFRCLPLSPVLDPRGEIMDHCTVVDCFKHFNAAEQVDNYRCNRCWHLGALKYVSENRGSNEENIKMIDHCVNIDSCDCKSLFLQEEITWTDFSRASKQLSIARCPRILCIHLQRASMNMHGELIKLQGHISFPLFLDLFPFTHIKTNVGQETLKDRVQLPKPLVPQLQNYLNMQREIHMLPQIYKIVSEKLSTETLPEAMFGKSIYDPLGHLANESTESVDGCEMLVSDIHGSQAGSICKTGLNFKVGSSDSSNYSKQCMYHLSSVVVHYGKPGSGHYAVYRKMGSSVGPLETLNHEWVYVSDREVSAVSEKTVLAAEASLLFYERIEE